MGCKGTRDAARVRLGLGMQAGLVVVVMMLLGFPDRNDAAMGHFALRVFELDGGVLDSEVHAEDILYFTQNALADRRRDVGDGDVAGERVAFRTNAPHVQECSTRAGHARH